MAKEVLAIPEQHLGEVISIIRAGLTQVDASEEVRQSLTQWCDDEEEYLNKMGEKP